MCARSFSCRPFTAAAHAQMPQNVCVERVNQFLWSSNTFWANYIPLPTFCWDCVTAASPSMHGMDKSSCGGDTSVPSQWLKRCWSLSSLHESDLRSHSYHGYRKCEAWAIEKRSDWFVWQEKRKNYKIQSVIPFLHLKFEKPSQSQGALRYSHLTTCSQNTSTEALQRSPMPTPDYHRFMFLWSKQRWMRFWWFFLKCKKKTGKKTVLHKNLCLKV